MGAIKELAVKAGLTPTGSIDKLDYRLFANLIIEKCKLLALKNDDPFTANDIHEHFSK